MSLFEIANSRYNEGQRKVKTNAPPKGQKFLPGSVVKIDYYQDGEIHGPRHLRNDSKYAVVDYTYAHAYPEFNKTNVEDYSLFLRLKYSNIWYSCAWFRECQLTKVNWVTSVFIKLMYKFRKK